MGNSDWAGGAWWRRRAAGSFAWADGARGAHRRAAATSHGELRPALRQRGPPLSRRMRGVATMRLTRSWSE
nr:unnamed protein product [Digitaria exilis]